MDNILSGTNWVKRQFFHPKSLISGIFKKSVLDIKDTALDYENVFGVKCTSGREPITNLDKVATSHSYNI